jgi:hypothetical protein
MPVDYLQHALLVTNTAQCSPYRTVNSASTVRTNRLVLFKEIIAVCCAGIKKRANTTSVGRRQVGKCCNV